jgi:hypothetical protein
MVESRERYVTTGLLVASARMIAGSLEEYASGGLPDLGFAVELVSAAIWRPSASKPSTQMNAESPTASGAHACVSGQRSWMRVTRCVTTTVL